MTALQLFAHGIGDYVLQSDWMASRKTKSFCVSLIHALTYSIPFLIFFSLSWVGFSVLVMSHAVIDRWRIARYICFLKNFMAPVEEWPFWQNCKKTGYPDNKPMYLSLWLMFITDNLLHVGINAIAITYL